MKYVERGTGKPVIFLHGFSISAKNYEKLIKVLAKNNRVIVPELNSIKRNPRTIKDDSRELFDFCNSLNLNDYVVVGYSQGGLLVSLLVTKTRSIKRLVLIDPAIPVDYTPFELVKRTIKIMFTELFGEEGIKGTMTSLKILPGFLFYMLRNLKSTKNLIREIDEFKYEKVKVKQPTLLLYANNDELFNLDKDLKLINKKFNNLKIKRINKRHDWLLICQDLAAKEIKRFI